MRYTDFFFYTNQPTLCARLHVIVNVIAVVILGLVNDDKTELLSCLYLWKHFKCTTKLRQEDQHRKWQQYIFFKVSGHPNYLPLMLFLVILVN